MVYDLRNEKLLSKVKVFHFIFPNYIKAGVVINEEMIISGVEKILWILSESWL